MTDGKVSDILREFILRMGGGVEAIRLSPDEVMRLKSETKELELRPRATGNGRYELRYMGVLIE